ncbi:hypothetical protein ACFY2Q_29120 [Micromonospora sp. NPDC000316]|uniref:hypothetical protein n=1 Tax=Micromonospora sp. NPDC000316 TaxID=3364216 RepID=UPI0036C0650E
MVRVVAIALVAMCVVLTVAFLAALRGVAELRLRLAQDDGAAGPPKLVIGRRLPDSVVEALAGLGELGPRSLVVLLSTTCGSCLRLAGELGRVQAPLVACVIGEPGPTADDVRASVPAGVPVIAGDVARQIRTDLNLHTFPTAIAQRDGYIVATGQGSGADTAANLDHLWRQAVHATKEAHA